MIKFDFVMNEIEFNKEDFRGILEILKIKSNDKFNLEVDVLDDSNLHIKLKYKDDIYLLFLENDYISCYLNCKIDVLYKNKSENYDKSLEMIKLFLKDAIKFHFKSTYKKDFKILWLEDLQILELSQKLYYEIHKTEASLRGFINTSMVKFFGYNWWTNIINEDIKNKHKGRIGDFHYFEKNLNDVSIELLSIDVSDLADILETKTKKLNPQNINDAYIESLKKANEKKDHSTILNLLNKPYEIEIDVWSKYYKKYFSENFISEWKMFYKIRNHIAHNKLITLDSYEILTTKLYSLQKDLDSAIEKFKYDILPKEIQEEIQELAEITEYQRIKQDRYIREVESGVEILFSAEIEERIEEFLSNELMKIEELFYLRNDIEIDINAINFENDNIKILEVKSKINENSLEFFINNIDIDETEGGESSLDLNIHTNSKLYRVLNIRYQNGEAEWDEFQSNYIPLKENEIIIDNYLEQFEELNEELNKLFPNLVNEIPLREFENIKTGGVGVVSHLECDDCGGEYLSIDESFLPVGTCANCGAKHSITQCNNCGSYYKIEDESVIPDMCENCYLYKLEKF